MRDLYFMHVVPLLNDQEEGAWCTTDALDIASEEAFARLVGGLSLVLRIGGKRAVLDGFIARASMLDKAMETSDRTTPLGALPDLATSFVTDAGMLAAVGGSADLGRFSINDLAVLFKLLHAITAAIAEAVKCPDDPIEKSE